MRNKKKNFIITISIILTVFRILLMARLPIWPLSSSGDDMLLVRYADSLLNGTWIMENYSSITLVKGISYSVFLAVCKIMGVPYFVGLALFYVGATILFVRAISPLVKEKSAQCVGYLFLLYSPAGFDSDIVQRVYRMAIIPPVVIIVFACFLGLWFRRDCTIKIMLPWVVGAGISVTFFWYIREDSIWMLPFAVIGMVLLLYHSITHQRDQLSKRILIFLLPICIFFVSSATYSVMNYKYYKTYLINDRTQGSFAEFSGNLLKIDPGIDENVPTAWIYKRAMDAFAEISPEFNIINEKMYTYDEWLVDGEFKGDLYQWAIRKAASDLGYYENSQKAEDLYKRLNNELNEAFFSNRIVKKDAIYFSSQTKGIEPDKIFYIIRDCIQNTFSLLSYEYMEMDIGMFNTKPLGNEQQIRLMETITNSVAFRMPTYEYRIRGTIQAKGECDTLELYLVEDDMNEITPIEIKQGTFFINDVDLDEEKEYSLNVYINGVFETNLTAEEVVDNSVFTFQAYDNRIEHVDYTEKYVADTERISNFFVKLYQKAAVPVLLLSVIFFCVFTINTFRDMKKKNYELWNIFFASYGDAGIVYDISFGNQYIYGMACSVGWQ